MRRRFILLQNPASSPWAEPFSQPQYAEQWLRSAMIHQSNRSRCEQVDVETVAIRGVLSAARSTRLSDWNIQSRGHQCHACNTAFEDGTSYHTAGSTRTMSMCGRIFAPPAGAGGRWSAVTQRIYLPPGRAPTRPRRPHRPRQFRKTTPKGLLRKLVETGEERAGEVSYILAVMFERARAQGEGTDQGRRQPCIRIRNEPVRRRVFTIPIPTSRWRNGAGANRGRHPAGTRPAGGRQTMASRTRAGGTRRPEPPPAIPWRTRSPRIGTHTRG